MDHTCSRPACCPHQFTVRIGDLGEVAIQVFVADLVADVVRGGDDAVAGVGKVDVTAAGRGGAREITGAVARQRYLVAEPVCDRHGGRGTCAG